MIKLHQYTCVNLLVVLKTFSLLVFWKIKSKYVRVYKLAYLC